MEKNNTVTPLDASVEIECRVIKDEKSPFKTMMSNAKDIDIDCFERISRSRRVNSQELYSALVDNNWWTCRELFVKRTKVLL